METDLRVDERQWAQLEANLRSMPGDLGVHGARIGMAAVAREGAKIARADTTYTDRTGQLRASTTGKPARGKNARHRAVAILTWGRGLWFPYGWWIEFGTVNIDGRGVLTRAAQEITPRAVWIFARSMNVLLFRWSQGKLTRADAKAAIGGDF